MAEDTVSWRYFRCTLATHDKFWNISLQDRAYIVQFGRNGTSGQGRVKTFLTRDAANVAVANIITQKLGKGYFEVDAVGRRRPRFDSVSPIESTPEPKSKPKPDDELREPKRAISFK